MFNKHRERRVDAAQDWWFASIAIPLLAATIGPFANVLSIAALVSYWRESLYVAHGQPLLGDLQGNSFKDPRWATGINAASLVTGYVGNFFLFCNFTQRVPYLIALPMTIILWFFSAFLVSLRERLTPSHPKLRPLLSQRIIARIEHASTFRPHQLLTASCTVGRDSHRHGINMPSRTAR